MRRPPTLAHTRPLRKKARLLRPNLIPDATPAFSLIIVLSLTGPDRHG
jgi:hypothetical protein